MFPVLTPVQLANPSPSPTPTPEEAPEAQALARGFPPLAKDLFPQGVRVIAVQGLPAGTIQKTTPDSAFNAVAAAPAVIDLAQERTLILLVPDQAREALALALEQGDRLIISLLARGQPGVSPGFTYWDFEEAFRADREQALAATAAGLSAGPARTPSPTPRPAVPTATAEQ